MSNTAKPRRPRREFDDEFKVGAVRLVLDERQPVGRVARDLDLTESALRTWVDRIRADRTKGRTGLTSEERDELRRLRKESRRLRVERDVLKKTRPSSRRRARKVRVHPDGEGHGARRAPLSDSQRIAQWVLCLGVSAALGAREAGPPAAGGNSRLT